MGKWKTREGFRAVAVAGKASPPNMAASAKLATGMITARVGWAPGLGAAGELDGALHQDEEAGAGLVLQEQDLLRLQLPGPGQLAQAFPLGGLQRSEEGSLGPRGVEHGPSITLNVPGPSWIADFLNNL